MMQALGQRKPMAIFLIIVGVLLLLLILLSSGKKKGAKEEDTQPESVHIELPDADITEVTESKSDAYTARHLGRSSRVDDYYDSCEVAWNAQKTTVEDPLETVGMDPHKTDERRPQTAKTAEELFASATPVQSGGAKQSNPYRETEIQREERHQRRREEAIDMANELTGRKDDEPAASEPERISLDSPVSQAARRGGIISSLDGMGSGVSSLESQRGVHSSDSEHPFKCVFLKDEKLKSGQRVSVRLLEDMALGAYLIPKNTHLQAYATIDSRLELDISSIEVNGHIIPLGMAAYDTDGMKGIYCPDAGEVSRTVKTSGLSTLGSVVGGRVGRLAGEVINTGVSIAQSKTGERTVIVPAGYTFFIVRKKQY